MKLKTLDEVLEMLICRAALESMVGRLVSSTDALLQHLYAVCRLAMGEGDRASQSVVGTCAH